MPDEPGVTKVRRRIVAEEVAKGIAGLIVSGHLAVGEKLPPERELARELNISRPSLREGIRALSALGIVRVEHGKGIWIALRPSDPFQLSSGGAALLRVDPAAVTRLRALVFAAAASLAALRASDASLEELIETLRSSTARPARLRDGTRPMVEALVQSSGAGSLGPLVELLWPAQRAGGEWDADAAEGAPEDRLIEALASRDASRVFEHAFRVFVPVAND